MAGGFPSPPRPFAWRFGYAPGVLAWFPLGKRIVYLFRGRYLRDISIIYACGPLVCLAAAIVGLFPLAVACGLIYMSGGIVREPAKDGRGSWLVLAGRQEQRPATNLW